jgi:hypothetical protein
VGDLILEWRVGRFGGVEVVQVDLLDAEATCAEVGGLARVFAVADGAEVRVVRAAADETTLVAITRSAG